MEKDIPAIMDDARTFLARKTLNVNGIFFLDRFNKNGSFFLQDFSYLFFSQSDGTPKIRAANSKVYFNVIRSACITVFTRKSIQYNGMYNKSRHVFRPLTVAICSTSQ